MLNSSETNSGTFDVKVPRYEELAVPKSRIDHTSNFNAFKVKRGALSYRITDTMNKLAQPKLRPNPENTEVRKKPVSKAPSSVTEDKKPMEARHSAPVSAMPPVARTRRPRQPSVGRARIAEEKPS